VRGFYVSVVNDRLRRPQHADTVGLLLVAGKNDAVVRFSRGAQQTPVGVANDLLPPAVRATDTEIPDPRGLPRRRTWAVADPALETSPSSGYGSSREAFSLGPGSVRRGQNNALSPSRDRSGPTYRPHERPYG